MSDLGALTGRAVQVRVGAVGVTVPHRTALEWIKALDRDPRTAALVLAQEGQREALMALASRNVTLQQVEQATHTVLAELTGRKWYAAMRLVYTSGGGDVLGEMTLAGLDPDRVSLGQWCAAVYRLLVRNLDAKERMRLDFELQVPPPGYEESWDDDAAYYEAMVADARKMQGG